jgi:putative toxin-antitoxin system antitoxin component (TIGR02293 family)
MANDQETVEASSIEAVIERAVEVIGNREEAMRWLGTPVRALGYTTPISLLSGPQGKFSVLATLARLEHGIM